MLPKIEMQSEFSLSDSMSLMSRWLLFGREWPELCLSPFFLCSPDMNWKQWYGPECYCPGTAFCILSYQISATS